MLTAFLLIAATFDEPAKPTAPVFKLTGAIERGDHVYLTFEVTNPNAAPLSYLGYTSDSFEPKIPAGIIAPIFRAELLQGKEWKAHKIGWCGTGIGPVSIPSKGKVAFEAGVPAAGWEEVRIGLVWFTAAGEKDPQIAWSSAIERRSVKKPE